jgi:hypothetical protein
MIIMIIINMLIPVKLNSLTYVRVLIGAHWPWHCYIRTILVLMLSSCRYYTTTLLHYYTTTLLHYYTTTLLHYYTTTLLHFYRPTRTHLSHCQRHMPYASGRRLALEIRSPPLGPKIHESVFILLYWMAARDQFPLPPSVATFAIDHPS